MEWFVENGQSVKNGEMPLRLRSRAILGVAAFLAWALLGPLPLLLSGTAPLHLWLTGSPAALSLGLGLYWLGRRPRVAQGLLLGAFPSAAILSAYLMQPDSSTALGTLATGAAALGMILYVAGAARILGGAMELAPSVSAHSSDEAHVPGERRRRLASALWVVLASAGVFCVLAVAPYVESVAELTSRFGEAAGEARLLMASAAASLGLGTLAFLVAPSLRARRASTHERRRVLARFVLYLSLLATLALLLRRLHGN